MNWRFKENCSVHNCRCFYSDIIILGHIKPEEILDDENQIRELNEAINLVSNFERKVIAKVLDYYGAV